MESNHHQCNLCKKRFKQKSSLVRHTRKCTLEPVPSVRQKACMNCITAKSRCDLKKPVCARCGMRGLECVYVQVQVSRPVVMKNVVGDDGGGGGGGTGNSDPSPSGAFTQQLPDPTPTPTTTTTTTTTTSLSSSSSLCINMNMSPDLYTYLDDDGTDFNNFTGERQRVERCSLRHIFPGYDQEGEGERERERERERGEEGEGKEKERFYMMTPSTSGDSPNSLCPASHTNGTLVQRLGGGGGGGMESGGESEDPWITQLAARRIEDNTMELIEHSSQTLLRAFRSWPRMLAKGIQLPPIIHFFQVCDNGMPRHLSRCTTLCKLWAGQSEDSGEIVRDAVLGEIEGILAKYHTFDAPTLLSALQSMNILLILLFFPSNRHQSSISPVSNSLFTSLQEMGNYVLSTGMVLHEEANNTCPPWRVWAHIEAKRRTLVCIYFLHWSYSVAHETRHFNCLQLGKLLAPGPKYLWQANDELVWKRLVEMWLEDADELGVLMMSILNATQRDSNKIPTEADLIG
ncbi:hypothetical protein GGS20DRAFT_430365 [Poronia punctata]|nr:hypothetical protein GGS20DRAFT_430365 [Poronia punctata]